jgi:periplasmic divalent cation tolerance protein
VTFVQIQFTIDDPVRADAIVAALLASRLVACGQRLGPMVSDYRWQGALARADEWLILLKTRAELAGAVVDAVVDAHPYETPEVLTFEIAGGAAPYLAWIGEST